MGAIGAPSPAASAATDASRRSGRISSAARSVLLELAVRRRRRSRRAASDRRRRAACRSAAPRRLPRGRRRRCAEEISSPTSTSGAMYSGVPIGAGPGVLRRLLAGDAEVHEHDPVLAQDQVVRLDVAVDDVLLVHVLQRLARLARVLDHVGHRQAGAALARQQPVEVRALDQAPSRGSCEPSSSNSSSTSTTRGCASRASSRASISKRAACAGSSSRLIATPAPAAVAGPVNGAHRARGQRRLDLVAARQPGSGFQLCAAGPPWRQYL